MSECFVWVLIYIPDSGEELGVQDIEDYQGTQGKYPLSDPFQED